MSRFGIALLGSLLTSLLSADVPPSPGKARTDGAVIQRLGEEADKFERSAHRFAAVETLTQTAVDESRAPRKRSRAPSLRGSTIRQIVSEYGFVPLDVRGGSLREVRIVVTVDGERWKRGNKGLESLANTIGAQTEKQHRKLLEEFEQFGLRGVATDFGQLILLFSRGRTNSYEFTFKGPVGHLDTSAFAYGYEQLDGTQAVSIHEGKQFLREKITGELWVRQSDLLPIRLSIDTTREVKHAKIRDISWVNYEMTSHGILLPRSVTHQQFVDGNLIVTDQYRYSDFKEIIPTSPR